MTYPGLDTFPGLLTFPGVWGLTWPPPGIVSVSVGRRPQVGVSTAAAGVVPKRLPWRPKVPVDVSVPLAAAVNVLPEMRVAVAAGVPVRLPYVADAVGGSVAVAVVGAVRVGSVVVASPTVPVVASVGLRVIPSPTIGSWSVTDTFDRANGAIGSSWTTSSLAPVINGNKAQAGTGGSNNTSNIHVALNVNRLGKTDHEVELTIVSPTGTAGLDGGVTAVLRSNGSVSSLSMVEIGVTGSAAFINTHSGGSATQRDSVTGQSFTSGQVLVARVVGNKYSLLRGGVEILSWTDSGGVFPVSAENDRFGFRVTNTKSFAGALSYAFAVDSVTARTI